MSLILGSEEQQSSKGDAELIVALNPSQQTSLYSKQEYNKKYWIGATISALLLVL